MLSAVDNVVSLERPLFFPHFPSSLYKGICLPMQYGGWCNDLLSIASEPTGSKAESILSFMACIRSHTPGLTALVFNVEWMAKQKFQMRTNWGPMGSVHHYILVMKVWSNKLIGLCFSPAWLMSGAGCHPGHLSSLCMPTKLSALSSCEQEGRQKYQRTSQLSQLLLTHSLPSASFTNCCLCITGQNLVIQGPEW